MDDAATRLSDPPESFGDYETRLIGQIAEHGWRTTSVGGGEGVAAFHYTTGFWRTFGRPEMITFDLTANVAHDLFGLMAQEIGQGRQFDHNEPVSGLIADEDVRFIPVDGKRASQYLRSSHWFYRGATFPCWQLVWGDAGGLFPWQDGFEPGLAGMQLDLSAGGDWGGLRI